MKEIADVAADFPVPHIQEQIVDVVKSTAQVRVADRRCDSASRHDRDR